MRVLMVSDVYFPRINGVSTSIRTFRRALARAGHECTLIAPEYPRANGDESGVLRVPARTVVLDPEDRLMKAGPLRRLTRRLASGAYDVVHAQTPFIAHRAALRLSRALGVPCVETYHTLFEEYLGYYARVLPDTLLRAIARSLSRRQCNHVDAVVVPSGPMRERLRGYGVRRPVHVIPTGIPLEEFAGGDGAGFRRCHGIAPERPVIAYVGRVAHEKNIAFLLRVLRHLRRTLPDVVLIIAGEGPALASLRRESTTLGVADAIRFVGYLARGGELLDCYRAADVFVFSSRTETQGLVLLEAMALGVPVVSTAVMGTRDILLPGRGALVAREDEAHFADQVETVLRDPALRKRLGREAREYAREWSDDACAQRMTRVYETVIADSAPGARGTAEVT